jgi:hypothetical protein
LLLRPAFGLGLPPGLPAVLFIVLDYFFQGKSLYEKSFFKSKRGAGSK